VKKAQKVGKSKLSVYLMYLAHLDVSGGMSVSHLPNWLNLVHVNVCIYRLICHLDVSITYTQSIVSIYQIGNKGLQTDIYNILQMQVQTLLRMLTTIYIYTVPLIL
jgi:hypothetical protein